VLQLRQYIPVADLQVDLEVAVPFFFFSTVPLSHFCATLAFFPSSLPPLLSLPSLSPECVTIGSDRTFTVYGIFYVGGYMIAITTIVYFQCRLPKELLSRSSKRHGWIRN